MKTIDELEQEIANVEKQLGEVDAELTKWKSRQRELHMKRDLIIKCIDKIKSDALSQKDWSGISYDWYEEVKKKLKDVFKIKSFRPRQLSVINCTLSGEDALVVMPTGAGKSLCFQLPALVKPGLTVVISPLVSLMEDQVRSLTEKNIPAMLISSGSKDANIALNALKDTNAPIKLLYVTPERLAKSKRFMANLQKCYEQGRLQRIAIDEVHCCSQWGHDFRPDYKHLGILRKTFPNVPILGLTATATSHVLTDVQKILNISGCLLIKSTFNRPNLFYQILEKPSSKDECLNILESLLKHRYKNESGIIYTYSIKDSQDITEGLRKRGLKVGCYHAEMEADMKSKMHTKWHEGYYQAIVATLAFGMGIDKPNVRFVIHHTISKTMENYYQESGRAGRDGLRAECVMLYRMQDIFKISSMVMPSIENKDQLYGMIKYCISGNRCRRQLLAEYFDENWGDTDCDEMCDICCNSQTPAQELDLELHCKTLASIFSNANKQDVKLTAQKLLDAWFLKGSVPLRHKGLEPRISRSLAEDVIAYLLTEGYLEEDYHYTAYTTIVYIKAGPNMYLINDPDFKLKMCIRRYCTFDTRKRAPADDESEPSPKKSKIFVVD
ncbi:ATP-dependent DNA helicase Q1-like [Epargyreus clarus]|uniref:ATP-dependent DNA helicase Q1-like n=1 Tax=Epargyreus clarus TaxID=520877 RepID=UPI003C2C7C29